jgi:hypothetical protein
MLFLSAGNSGFEKYRVRESIFALIHTLLHSRASFFRYCRNKELRSRFPLKPRDFFYIKNGVKSKGPLCKLFIHDKCPNYTTDISLKGTVSLVIIY